MSSISSVISFLKSGGEQRCIYRKQKKPLRMLHACPWEEEKEGQRAAQQTYMPKLFMIKKTDILSIASFLHISKP